jgi:hypothetical protein
MSRGANSNIADKENKITALELALYMSFEEDMEQIVNELKKQPLSPIPSSITQFFALKPTAKSKQQAEQSTNSCQIS